MTLVIAVLCSDGVIMASDSQSTEINQGVRYSGDKVFELTNRALWGASGTVQVIRDIGDALSQARPMLEAGVADIGQVLSGLIRPQLARHYANYVHVPMTQPNTPQTTTLACGFVAPTGGWIVEVDQNCQYSYYHDRGFHAIGSAAGFGQLANALMAHFQVKDKPLSHGKLIAYRAMDTAIKTSAYGVGPPIQMSVVDGTGVHKLSAEELQELASGVGGWMQVESETLGNFLKEPEPEAAPASPEPAMPAEMPNATDQSGEGPPAPDPSAK